MVGEQCESGWGDLLRRLSSGSSSINITSRGIEIPIRVLQGRSKRDMPLQAEPVCRFRADWTIFANKGVYGLRRT